MAETKNYDNVRVFGDEESEVLVGPLGTVLPVDLTTVDVAFKALGWLGEDGVPLSVSTNTEKFKAWQGGTTLRTKVTSTEKSISVQAVEENPLVYELFYDAKPAVVTGTVPNKVAKIDLPGSIGSVSRSAVIKYVDGGVSKWLCCPKVEVTDRGDVAHTNSSMTIHEMTFEIIGDAYILTNAPAFIPAV